ncbi:hypothetical protein G6L37_04815 [Agrobacterium rubi]|nr:hypothetical protein [Agrobacterium rubi]NTF24676.1 hypothetical protein [Agrobacterium rubi]
MTGYISGEEDMLEDLERIDAALSQGVMTPYLEGSITILAHLEFDVADIAGHLCLEISQVEAVLAKIVK